MEGRGAVDWRIKPLDSANAVFAGVALTCHSYPADFFGVAGAAMEAEAGDVIMCNNEYYTGTAVIGDLAAGAVRNKSGGGVVADGVAGGRGGGGGSGGAGFALG